MIKSRRIRWAGHVAYTGQKRATYSVSVGNAENNRPLDGKENIKIILDKLDRLDSFHSGQRPVAGSSGHDYKHSGYIKGREFVSWLRSCWFQKTNSASRS
jgi:hypothetical protein